MAGLLYLVKDTLNIMSLIGLILLMALVTKNAILTVDFTNVQRRAGLSRREALIAATRAVIGGLITSTLLTLIVVPVIYTFLDDLGRLFARPL